MAFPSPLPPVIFFDAVGTLLLPESSPAEVYASVGRQFGSRLDASTVASRFSVAVLRQERDDAESGLRTSEARELARWRAIVAEVLDDVSDAEACFQTLYTHFSRTSAWRCAEDAAEVLNALSARGHLVGIASNFDRRLRPLVESLPSLRAVRLLVISSEVGWRKPAAAFFEAMCRSIHAPAQQILHVGDDLANDFEGASAAGMQALLLDRRQSAPSVQDHRIESLRALLP